LPAGSGRRYRRWPGGKAFKTEAGRLAPDAPATTEALERSTSVALSLTQASADGSPTRKSSKPLPYVLEDMDKIDYDRDLYLAALASALMRSIWCGPVDECHQVRS